MIYYACPVVQSSTFFLESLHTFLFGVLMCSVCFRLFVSDYIFDGVILNRVQIRNYAQFKADFH